MGSLEIFNKDHLYLMPHVEITPLFLSFTGIWVPNNRINQIIRTIIRFENIGEQPLWVGVVGLGGVLTSAPADIRQSNRLDVFGEPNRMA